MTESILRGYLFSLYLFLEYFNRSKVQFISVTKIFIHIYMYFILKKLRPHIYTLNCSWLLGPLFSEKVFLIEMDNLFLYLSYLVLSMLQIRFQQQVSVATCKRGCICMRFPREKKKKKRRIENTVVYDDKNCLSRDSLSSF